MNREDILNMVLAGGREPTPAPGLLGVSQRPPADDRWFGGARDALSNLYQQGQHYYDRAVPPGTDLYLPGLAAGLLSPNNPLMDRQHIKYAPDLNKSQGSLGLLDGGMFPAARRSMGAAGQNIAAFVQDEVLPKAGDPYAEFLWKLSYMPGFLSQARRVGAAKPWATNLTDVERGITPPLGWSDVDIEGLLGRFHIPSVSSLPIAPTGRVSRLDSERMGQWHDIGVGKKLDKVIPGTNKTDFDMPEMRRLVESKGLLYPYKSASPEALQGGAIIPLIGDRSAAGGRLTEVGGARLKNPVELHGGQKFMQSNPDSAWASDQGFVTRLNKLSNLALQEGKTPYGTFVPMGWDSMNFNHMMLEAVLGQMKTNGVSKTGLQTIDRAIRKVQKQNAVPAAGRWKGGLLNDDGYERLMEGSGNARTTLMGLLQRGDLKGIKGVPDIAETRYAIADSGLLHTKNYHGGQNISSLTGEQVLNPTVPHPSYPAQLERDQYIGGFQKDLPISVLFPDFYKARRAAGKPELSDPRSFGLGLPVQDASQEWLDGVMRYTEGLL